MSYMYQQNTEYGFVYSLIKQELLVCYNCDVQDKNLKY